MLEQLSVLSRERLERIKRFMKGSKNFRVQKVGRAVLMSGSYHVNTLDAVNVNRADNMVRLSAR